VSAVVDRSGWPVVSIRVRTPEDLDTLADELAEILAGEERFALSVEEPGDIGTLERMLWAAPTARRRLRRQRLQLAAWCDAAAHVLSPPALKRAGVPVLRNAELIWGCTTLATASADEAATLLRDRLNGHERHFSTNKDARVPLAAEAV